MPPSKTIWMTRWLAVLSLCLICSTLVSAQSTGGRILGRIADATGAVLGGVKVTLTNEATGVSAETKTNSTGDYVFPQVAVGVYRLEFDLAGFKKNLQRGVNVDLNQVLTINSIMQVGERRETVEVTSEAPLVDTTSTQLGAVMDERSVSNLPLNSRDTYQLLQLQPGVQGVGGSDLFYGSNTAGSVSVNGGRGRSNNFNVNGGDSNDLFVNSPAIQPTPDSIAEFRVLSNTFDAEYGRNSGAVINVVTKSGTNGWHGSLYEFLRNQMFNSKGYLDPRRPDDKQNQFGGTFGGPIVKDRTFFFASYEGRRVVHGITSDPVVVPTAAERNGELSLGGSVGTQLFADILSERCGVEAAEGSAYSDLFTSPELLKSCFDPVAADILDRFVPLPNSPDSTFRSIPNDRSHANQVSLKLDHRINEKQNLSLYYFFNDSVDAQPFTRFQAATPNLLEGFGNNNAFRVQQVNLSHTWTLSNSTVNEARLTYFREAQGTFLHPQRTNNVIDSCNSIGVDHCFNGVTDAPVAFSKVLPEPLDANNPKYGITPNLGSNREGIPFISVSGGFTIGNNFEGELPQIGNSYQLSDNLTKVIGSHTTKFGVDLREQRFLQTLYFDVSGDYSFFGGGPNDTGNLFANYLLGLPDSYLQGSAQTEDVRGKSVYLFAQDSWKIKPNLTLNYGLRWEFNQPIYDAGKRYQTFRPGQVTTTYPCQLSADSITNFEDLGIVNPDCNNTGTTPVGLVVPGDKGVPRGLTASYYNAWAPRVGIAWDPWKNGKTTIRGGWGMFYNPIEQLVLEQFQAEPPFGGSSLISEGLFNTPFIGQDGTKVPNPFNGILTPPPGTPTDWSAFRPILLFGELEPKLRAQYTAQYNFGITRELAKDLVLSIGYVGSQGHRLLATKDINYGNPQTCIDLQNISDLTGDGDLACGPFYADSSFTIAAGEIPEGVSLHMPYGSQEVVTGPNPTPITLVGLRKYSSPGCDPFTGNGCPPDGVPVFSSIFAQDTIASSNYNSLQTSLEKRMAHGLQFEIAYTWSKSIDNASSFENIVKPICDRCNRSLSLFDARHRFVLSYLWQLPVPQYQGAKGKFLNGWAVSGVTSFQTGFPIRILSSNDAELMNSFDFELPGKPDLVKPFHAQDPRKNNKYAFDPTAFALPVQDANSTPLQLLGNSPRTICCGPGINNFDFSVQKVTQIGESKHLEFRAEFFNVFNHTQFLNPDGNISDGADFGRVKRTRDPRQVQFALKFSF
ncbi:MAG: TonB-dependent receptor [Acidobacteriales bacterium]|nr:TonB-dependent receptor [Terriglobales bacterium]